MQQIKINTNDRVSKKQSKNTNNIACLFLVMTFAY